MSAGSHSPLSTTETNITSPRTTVGVHSGSGTLRGGGVSRVYGNMASLKQYKDKIDVRLPVVTIVCLACIALILFLYGLYQLKGHDTIVEYVKNTRDIAKILNREKRQDEGGADFVPALGADFEEMNESDVSDEAPLSTAHAKVDEQVENETIVVAPIDVVESTTAVPSTTTTTNFTPSTPIMIIIDSSTTALPIVSVAPEEKVLDSNVLTVPELNQMHDDFVSAYITIWNLFAVNLIMLLFLVPATVLFHIDLLGINKYKTIFRFVVILMMLFLIIQLLYLISPILTCSCAFPGYIDRLFSKQTEPKYERGIAELQSAFSCDFDPHQVLIDRGLEDPCIPKLKDSLFPCYAAVMLIVLNVVPFVFAFFTYAWDAWLKNCSAVREARMRVELNNQRRPQTREQIFEQAMHYRHSGNSGDEHLVL